MNQKVGSNLPLAAEALRPQSPSADTQRVRVHSAALQLAVRNLSKQTGTRLLEEIFSEYPRDYKNKIDDLVELARNPESDSYFSLDDVFAYFVENGDILNKTKADLCTLFQDLPKEEKFEGFCTSLNAKFKNLKISAKISEAEFKRRLALLLFNYSKVLSSEDKKTMTQPVKPSTGKSSDSARAFNYNQEKSDVGPTSFMSTDPVSEQGIFARIKLPDEEI